MTELIEHSTFITNLIATQICTVQKLPDRVKVIALFMGVAEELLAMKNYNGFVAVAEAIYCHPVQRLQNTFNLLKIQDPNTQLQGVRIKTELEAQKNSQFSFPSVPYFHDIVHEIDQIADLPDMVDGLHNWEKRMEFLKFYNTVKHFQQSGKIFADIPENHKFRLSVYKEVVWDPHKLREESHLLEEEWTFLSPQEEQDKVVRAVPLPWKTPNYARGRGWMKKANFLSMSLDPQTQKYWDFLAFFVQTFNASKYSWCHYRCNDW